MGHAQLKRLILIALVVGRAFANPANQSTTIKDEHVKEGDAHMKEMWERDRVEMGVYEGKGTEYPASDYNATGNETPYNHNVESWSLVLYLVCFFVLIIFFLLISIMEVCCKRAILNVAAAEEPTVTSGSPPPYDLFGPPSYDSLYNNDQKRTERGRRSDVFVIRVPKRRNNSNAEGIEIPTVHVHRDANPPHPTS